MLTKNVFELVADVVKQNTKDLPEVNANVCKAFAGEFSKSNPRFREDVFEKRCRIDREKV